MKANVTAYLNFRYEKIRLLKKSERGEVWIALNKSTNQPVVMKIINLTGLPYLQLKENPNPLIAKIFYCAESESDTVVVEEFITGETLDGKILTETAAKNLLLQICDGLKFLHGIGIIHRDIKPSNLILQDGGKIRLIDFDAARIFDETKTADTKLLGTKGYAPPEQFGFGQTDSRSDIYSLGKTFLELTGENCGSLKKILSKCIEVDPKNRYQNISELQAALTKKKFPFAKICATFAAVVTVSFLFFNSTIAEIFPAEIEKVSDIETPAEIENAPEKIETSAEIDKNSDTVKNPAKTENNSGTVKTPSENETTPKKIEPPATVENIPETVEDVPKTKRRAEIITPLPQPDTNNNFQPSLPNPNTTLENFQPSFPTAPTFNPENETAQNLGGVKLGDSLENVRAILGNELEIKTYDGLNFANHFYKNLNVTIENNQATCISTKNADVATLRGIRQGDSIEKVLARYGDNFYTRQFGAMTVYIYNFDSAELRFTVENNLVAAITLISPE
mgnify:CR=1 FL=1